MLGKEKCRILKEIRQKIADENDIPWVTRECTHKGECRGTCPKCESELRELERQLAARQAVGRRVTVAALCAGLAFSSVGCTRAHIVNSRIDDLSGAVAPIETPEPDETPDPGDWQIMGEVPYGGDLDGEIELAGDVEYIEPGESAGEIGDEGGADG